MRYAVFIACNVIFLLVASVDCRGYRLESRPVAWSGHDDHDINDDNSCSEKVSTELSKIRADLRYVKSLLEGLRLKLDPDFKPVKTEKPKGKRETTTHGVIDEVTSTTRAAVTHRLRPRTPDQITERELITAKPGPCPEGFEYLSEARGCYKGIGEKREWSSAMEQCRSLNPKAHLISIESRRENEAVTRYLNEQFPRRGFSLRSSCYRHGQPGGHGAFWTSGQRVNTSDCRSEFVWKKTAEREAPVSYNNWLIDQPNCIGGDENCAEILLVVSGQSDFNHIMCNVQSCSLCEYDLN